MAEQTVLFHTEDFEDVEELTDSDAGILLKAICRYLLTGETDERLNAETRVMFRYIRRHIDRDKANYREVCRKRSEAGRLGGRPRNDLGFPQKPKKAIGNSENQNKAKEANGFEEKQKKQSKAKKADYENDYDYENDNDYVSDYDYEAGAVAADAAADGPMDEKEREKRIHFLETMLKLCKSGAIEDADSEERYRAEYQALTGGV